MFFLAAWAVGLADEPDVGWLDVIAAALDLLIDLADPDVWPGLLPACGYPATKVPEVMEVIFW